MSNSNFAGLYTIKHKDAHILASKVLENRKIWIESLWEKAIDDVEKIQNVQRKGIALKLFGPKTFQSRSDVRKKIENSSYSQDYFYYKHRPITSCGSYWFDRVSDILETCNKNSLDTLLIEVRLLAFMKRLQTLKGFKNYDNE